MTRDEFKNLLTDAGSIIISLLGQTIKIKKILIDERWQERPFYGAPAFLLRKRW